MNKFLLVILASLFATISFAQEAETQFIEVDCSWGTLTMEAIEGGLEMGPHSADPSGDGQNGSEDEDQPRSGLGNVVEQGNLQATCEFIRSQL
jgi:hypothetical protein